MVSKMNCLLVIPIHEKCNVGVKIEKEKSLGAPPPLCKLSSINIGQYFLNLITKHFNKIKTPLNKIFKRKSVKISYSCTDNMYQIINSHNNYILSKFHGEKNLNLT